MVERKDWWKGVCILGVALAFALLLFTSPALAWWNTDWKYRRAITIQSDDALTDYQILIQLNSSNFDFSKANPDGSDIRFVDEDDATKLSYWIEEWNASSQTAKIWVNVPSIPIDEKTIYLYYNNSEATSESDGDAVFEFFDDFDEGTTPNPDKWSSQGSPSISEGCLILDAADEHVYSDGSEGHTADTYLIYECKAYVDSCFSFNVIKPDEKQILSSGSYGFATLYWSNLYTQTGNGGRAEADRGAYTTDEWKIVKVTYLPDKMKWELPEGNFEHTTQIPDPSQSMHIGIWTTADGYTNKIDWIRVRIYTEPEPSTLVGEEEEIPPPIEVVCKSPSILQIVLHFTEKNGHIFLGTSPDKFAYAYEFHGSGTYTLTTTFLQPNKTYYIKACDTGGNCTDVVAFVCSEKTDLEKRNFTSAFNNLMQGGNLLNISKLGETIPSVYTSLLTDMFWAMFFGGIFLAYWIRQEDVMLPSIVGMISGSVLIVMLPPSAQHIAYILLVISIAGTLYTIIKARR